MSWLRIDDKMITSAKILGLVDDGVRGERAIQQRAESVGAWTMLLTWASSDGTDGFIPSPVVDMWVPRRALTRLLRVRYDKQPLLHERVNGVAPECPCLEDRHWPADSGYALHDFLDYNPSVAEKNVARAKRRELGDKELRRLTRVRDGNSCRYCGIVSSWAVHRGPKALQVEHIDPRLADGLSNLVVSCAACNTKKARNTPAAAGLTLLPPPVSVPKGGWKPGDEDTIERAWPPGIELPTEWATGPIVGLTVGPITGPTDDRTVDRSSVGSDGATVPSADRSTRDATADAPPVPSYPGPGGVGVAVGTAPGQVSRPTRVGPATTRRTALSPNPYLKSHTTVATEDDLQYPRAGPTRASPPPGDHQDETRPREQG